MKTAQQHRRDGDTSLDAEQVEESAVRLAGGLTDVDLDTMTQAQHESPDGRILALVCGRELARRRAERAEALLRYCVGDEYFAKMQEKPTNARALWDQVEVACQIAQHWREWILDYLLGEDGAPAAEAEALRAQVVRQAEASRAQEVRGNGADPLMPTLDGRTLTPIELRWGFGRLASAMDWLVGAAVTRELLTSDEWQAVDKLASVAKIHGDFLRDLLAEHDEASGSNMADIPARPVPADESGAAEVTP